MGLDQYAFAVMPHPQNTDLYVYWNDRDKVAPETTEASVHILHTWRKHANLQGYMEALYEKKGGEGTFNCTPVRLTFQDLKDLKQAVMNNKLPQTVGFFFGTSDPDHDTETLEFVDLAMKAIAQDMEIYYDSWW
jgi:hypothetical protein